MKQSTLNARSNRALPTMNIKLKSTKAAIKKADSIIDSCHLFYNKAIATRYLKALIEKLQERISEFDK